MKRLATFIKKEANVLGGLFIIFAIVALWSTSSRAISITNSIYDAIRTTPTRKEAVIVGIDDKSLQLLGAWPWNRSVFASLTTILSDAGAKVIIYDTLFLEPREGDDLFRKALISSKAPVVLASKWEGSQHFSSYLTASSTHSFSSFANVDPDSDGKVRKYPDRRLLAKRCERGLGEEAFLLYTSKQSDYCQGQKGMFRYPDSIQTYSLADVLAGKTDPSLLKGRVVFIGSTALDLEDHFVGIHGNKVPGVYVHASIFTSLLNSVDDQALPTQVSFLSLAVLMLLTAALMYTVRSVLLQLGGTLFLLVVVSVLSAASFSYGIQLPLPSYLISIIAGAGYTAGANFIKERAKNARIQSLFSKYVHKDVLEELISSGKDIRLGGEKREISVLFSDIRGFTALSETLSPEDLTSTLNAYLSAMVPEILEEKGTIDKFIGDAIMAFWNAPLPTPDHALHAVRSGLRMQDALRSFNKKHNTSLAIGVGIHTGDAVVGNIGSSDHVNYTALGDTVNLASRLESLTKKYKVSVLVTQSVRDAIHEEDIAFRCLDVITVLGKTAPTTLYEVRWKKDLQNTFKEEYEHAYAYYSDKEWDKAEHLLEKLAKEGDIPSGLLLARIPDARKNENWDRVWKWDEK